MATAEVQARLGLDIKPFESALAQSGKSLSEFGKRATKDFGSKDAGRAVAAAIGLNITDIADQFARLWTGVSKASEDAWKTIADNAKEIANIERENAESRLNDEAKYQLKLKQRAKALKNPEVEAQSTGGALQDAAGGALVKGGLLNPLGLLAGVFLKGRAQSERSDQVKAGETTAQRDAAKLDAEALKLKESIEKRSRANSEKERDLEEDKLSVGQKAFALMDDLDALEAESVKMNKTSLEYTEQQTRILDKKKQIQDQLNKLGAEEGARLKKEKEDEQKLKDLKKDRVQAVADVGEAQKNLENAQMDPSRLTIDELSKLDRFDPRTSTQAASLISQAQDIKGLEGKGEEARRFGRVDDAKGFFDQADAAKKALTDTKQVKSSENPAQKQVEELVEANKKLETINTALKGKFANQ